MCCVCQGVFTLGDARSFFGGLASKNPSLGSLSNFDADVKKTTARHYSYVKTASGPRVLRRHCLTVTSDESTCVCRD